MWGKCITLSTVGKWNVIEIIGNEESVVTAVEELHITRETVSGAE